MNPASALYHQDNKIDSDHVHALTAGMLFIRICEVLETLKVSNTSHVQAEKTVLEVSTFWFLTVLVSLVTDDEFWYWSCIHFTKLKIKKVVLQCRFCV